VKDARKVAKEALRAQRRREKGSKAANRRPRVMTAQQKVVKKSAAPTRQPLAQIAPNQQISRSGRIIKKSARLL
jgi:hypothetical protein